MSNDELPRDPNADITDAISALPASQRDLAMAIIDRVSALTGLTELRFMDRQQAVNDMLLRIEENQAAFSHPLGALVAKQDLITEHLQRQDVSLSGLKEGQAVLRSEFQETGEALNQWRSEVEATLADFRESRNRSVEERNQLRADLDESKADRRALHVDLEESKADRKVLHADLEESKADRKAIRHEQQAHNEAITAKLNALAAAIEELRLGVNGRLTQLIKESKAASRAEGQAEGHDEERADPGSG